MKLPLVNWIQRVVWKPSDLVGMDPGAAGVKFVRVHRRPGSRGSWELLQCAIYPGNLLADPEKEIPACRDFLEEQHLTGASVACALEHPSLKIRRLDLPKMPEADLKEAVRWQLRDVAEGSIDTYVVRHALLDEYAAGDVKRVSLMVYLVKKEVVASLLGVLTRLSLKPVAIEPMAVSLLAAFDQSRKWEKGETYGVIDLGQSKSLFLVVGDEKLYFSRPMSGISLSEAGDNFFTALAIEIQRSMDGYSLLFKKERVDRLFLSGGGAGLEGLADHLTKNLGIPTEILDPLGGRRKEGEGVRFGVALGLALAG